MKLFNKRFIPLTILIFFMTLAYTFDLSRFFNFETFEKHKNDLITIKESYPLSFAFFFMFLYILVTSLSIPGAAFLSVICGFLFPQPYSLLMVITSATIGATIIFSIAKSSLGNSLRKKAAPQLQKIEKKLRQDAASYLLFMRFVPAFPFWFVNIAPAFCRIPLSTFIWTTFVGIIPGAFLFTQAGRTINTFLQNGEPFSPEKIFTPTVYAFLIALAIFSLLPIFIKSFYKK